MLVVTPQTFALDYDDTFTAAPELWSMFVTRAKEMGHRVVLVTARRETDENVETIRASLRAHNCVLPIVCSNMGSKLDAVKKRGIDVSVWIDDRPEKIATGY